MLAFTQKREGTLIVNPAATLRICKIILTVEIASLKNIKAFAYITHSFNLLIY